MSTPLRMSIAFGLFVALGQSTAQQRAPADSGKQRCSGAIYGTVVQALGERPLTNMLVYVFTLAQSRRLREMDESAYARARTPGGENVEMEEQNDSAVIDLIPKLPRTALVKSDSRGTFGIPRLPCGQRYCLVSFIVTEGGLILAAKVTPMLKNGETMKIELPENGQMRDRFKPE